jgi:hypothetical protein
LDVGLHIHPFTTLSLTHRERSRMGELEKNIRLDARGVEQNQSVAGIGRDSADDCGVCALPEAAGVLPGDR